MTVTLRNDNQSMRGERSLMTRMLSSSRQGARMQALAFGPYVFYSFSAECKKAMLSRTDCRKAKLLVGYQHVYNTY